MKILIDARVIKRYPGLGRCCYNIVKGLALIDHANEYIVMVLEDSLNFLNEKENFSVFHIDIPVLSLRTLYSFSRFINSHNPGVFYSPFQVTALRVSCPSVITVNDMMDLMYKDAFSHHPLYIEVGLKAFFKYTVPRTIKQASRIITISESTKQQLCDYMNINRDMVRVIYPGVEKRFRPAIDKDIIETVRKKYCLPDRYILYLGSTKLYKNLGNALKAFSLVKTPNIKLVIGGLKHFASSDIPGKIKKLELKSRVINIGYVDDKDLPTLYSEAEIFLFPSIWEGFGLPALEAMACGTPVVASNTTSLPEVVGDAGILVDPYDVNGIAYNLDRLLKDPGLRSDLSERGIRRARTFTWERTVRETFEVIEQTYKEGRA